MNLNKQMKNHRIENSKKEKEATRRRRRKIPQTDPQRFLTEYFQRGKEYPSSLYNSESNFFSHDSCWSSALFNVNFQLLVITLVPLADWSPIGYIQTLKEYINIEDQILRSNFRDFKCSFWILFLFRLVTLELAGLFYFWTQGPAVFDDLWAALLLTSQ